MTKGQDDPYELAGHAGLADSYFSFFHRFCFENCACKRHSSLINWGAILFTTKVVVNLLVDDLYKCMRMLSFSTNTSWRMITSARSKKEA
jgi:hypothetical protein